MARKVSGKKPAPLKTSRESGAKTADAQKLQAWLDASGSLYEPDFGQDDPAGPRVHIIKPNPYTVGLGRGDKSVDDETFDADLDPMMKHIKEILQGIYGTGGETIRNKTELPGAKTGPAINIALGSLPRPGLAVNTPLPGRDLGPLINTSLGGGAAGPLINLPLAGMPTGPAINVALGGKTGGVTKAALLKLKAQQQAKAHGYAHLVA